MIANIASIEASADANPHDVEKQVALFNALVDTQVKAGYDVVISRWERMCEFVSPRYLPCCIYPT
jgi:ATP-dependent metalloprotease